MIVCLNFLEFLNGEMKIIIKKLTDCCLIYFHSFMQIPVRLAKQR
jgi:hypothetical protein